MSHSSPCCFALVFLALSVAAVPSTKAQGVPQLLNYQGRVAVGGVNFSGPGQFKFALVNADGSETYWSNDGSSSVGSEPAAAVSLPVAGGLYSVLLGDATIPNMTAVPATVFANEDVRLRVWFSDGTHGSQRLTPDQRLAAVGYALMADGVKAGGVTGAMIAAGAIGSAQIADGSIGSTQLGAGAAAANLAASSQSAVGSGGLILSATDNNAALAAAGYVRVGATTTPDAWQARAAVSPAGRYSHTAVWTGAEMIVWGGYGATTASLGSARYDPSTNAWNTVAVAVAPSARYSHTAVWTGSEMMVWGGISPLTNTPLSDGGRYNPATNLWVSLNAASPPVARYNHTAVWTGAEMIVWGGFGTAGFASASARADGGRYNPSANAWTALPASGLAGRGYHSSVWTGTEMIVWGGWGGINGAYFNNGARYNPGFNAWALLPTSGAPAARSDHAAVWTGSEMLVWGGDAYYLNAYYGDGARYAPAANAWTPLSAAGAPAARSNVKAVWTGTEMILWGGYDATAPRADGARYDPAADAWTSLADAGAPPARRDHTAVWTGSEMIVWGGSNPAGNLGDGARYDPTANAWNPVAVTGASLPRYAHTAVWTGSEMIVWGGTDTSSASLADGGRFNPALNAWTPVASAGQPAPRFAHTAVWTGAEMIVWGGRTGSNPLASGARYDPVADAWTPTSATSAPAARYFHTAVWTGSEMIVWGGGLTTPTTYYNTGSRYDPTANAWTSTPVSGAPTARLQHTAVWTGSDMIVWGGYDASGTPTTGARYRPSANAWTATSTANVPTARYLHTAVWTGTEMIVWGGTNGTPLADGGRYNPVANTWTFLAATGAPAARYQHTAVWTGSEMIVWGGAASSNTAYADGARFSVANNAWTPLASGLAPIVRSQHTAVWAGNEMIVFGGYGYAAAVFMAFNDAWSLTPGRTLYLYQRP